MVYADSRRAGLFSPLHRRTFPAAMNTVKRSLRDDHSARPWWPKTQRNVEAVVDRLRHALEHELFAFLVIAAAGGEWKIFHRAMEVCCRLRPAEVDALVQQVGATPDWSSAYARGCIPPDLFAFFVKVVEIRRQIERESPEVAASSRLRPLVLKKALLASGASARVSPELKTALAE